MPGEKQVGSVSIRVVPDTTRFKAELERQLASIKDLKITANLDLDKGAAQAELDRISAERPTITANLDLDTGAAEIQKALLKKPVKIPAQVDVNQSAVARAAAKLKAVHIPADVDNKNLQSLVGKAFAGIGTQHIKADVDINQDSLAKLLKPIDELHAVKVKVQADIDKATIAREMENLHLKAQLDLDKSAFDRALADAEAGFRKLESIKFKFNADQDPFKQMLRGIRSDIGSLVQRDLGSLESAFSAVGAAGSAAFESVGMVASGAFTALVKFPVIATAIAEAGAVITAAWGAASTAVAAVPAAIGLIGAPLATVLLGMDGIKKAAQTLAPEFNKLKSAVSATFQQGLTPIFNQLKGTMTALTPVIQDVAKALVGQAKSLADFVTKGQGLNELKTAFSNVAAAVKDIDLIPLVDGFLRLAGNSSALKALTTTVNGLGKAIQDIANNPALNKAFDGLGGVLGSLTRAFSGLVNNGIKLFATAAPGIQSAIDSITGFFGRFNYEKLGGAVGNAFKGIGDAVKQIPQSTIKSIEDSFVGLGDALNSQNFKDGIQGFATALPLAIKAVGAGVTVFGALGQSVGGAAQFIEDASSKTEKLAAQMGLIDDTVLPAGQAFDEFGNRVNVATGSLDDVQPAVDGVSAAVATLPQVFDGTAISVQKSLSQLPVVTQQQLDQMPPIFRNVFGTLGQVVDKTLGPDLGNAARQGIDGMNATVKDGVSKTTPIVQTGLDPLVSAMGAKAKQGAAAFATGLGGLLTGTQQAIKPVPGEFANLADLLIAKGSEGGSRAGQSFGGGLGEALSFGLKEAATTTQTGFVPVAGAATTGTQSMVDAVNAAIPGLGTAIQTGLNGIATLVTTAFGTNLSLAVGTGMLQMQNAVTLGMAGLQLAFTTGLGLIATGITTSFATTLSLAVGTGMLQMQNAVTLGMAGIQLAFTTGFGLIATGITTSFGTTLSLAVGTGMLQMQNAVTLGMAGIQLAFTTGFGLIATGITTSFATTLSLAVGTGMLQIQNAVTLGMAGVSLAFQQGFANIASAGVTPGMTAIAAAVTAGFTQVVAAVTAGMVLAKTEVTTGMTNMTTEVTTGGTKMVQAITQAMTQFTAAVKTGMTQAEAAAKSGISAIVAALNSGASQAQAAGVNLGQAFVRGIESQVSAARAAGAKLGQAAVDGINSAKGIKTGSPSKKGIASGENLGGAFAIGMANLEAKVSSSGASLGALAAESILDNTPDISADLLDTLGVSDIVAQVDAVFASGDFNLPSSGSKPVIDLGGIKVYVGDREITDIVRVELAADKEDLLLKSRAG